MVGLSDRSVIAIVDAHGRPIRACTGRHGASWHKPAPPTVSDRAHRREGRAGGLRDRWSRRPGPAASADAVRLQEREGAAPAILRGLLAVARPVVGVEAVRSVRVDDELHVLAGGVRRVARGFDRGDRDAGVGAPIEAEQRRVQLAATEPALRGWMSVGSPPSGPYQATAAFRSRRWAS